ncbi:MAG: YicC family protein [Nitrospirales bacterium]|nr:YicC family protein [Nitrospirales bacterium]
MIQGMTGFGASEKGGFRVEVRSLNHKYMDISVKLPSALMSHDIPMRNLLKERFSRGKFDVAVSFAAKEKSGVRLNMDLAKAAYREFADLQRELSLSGDLGFEFLARYKDILMTDCQEYDEASLYEALGDAVSGLTAMRRLEGSSLAGNLMERVGRLKEIEKEMEGLAPEVPLLCQELLIKRVKELLSAAHAPLDETRIAHEAALIAQKADITEELERLRIHIDQFASLLLDGGVIGRRLDFILQEMHRETNTIASKMDDIRIIALTIETRTEIEKLREQVQNIQ